MTLATYSIVLQGRSLTYTLARKAVKNINLRIRGDGSVYVSASPQVPQAYIEGFLRKQAPFILKALSASQNRPPFLTVQDGETLLLAGKPYRLDVRLGLRNTVRRSGQTVYMEITENTAALRQKLYHELLRREGTRLFAESLERMLPYMQEYAVSRPKLRQRIMRSRWGSCMPGKEIITMNTYLASMPPAIIDHVMLHELCHLVHPDHSRHFYNVMTRIMPDWKERNNAMTAYLPYCV